MDVTAQFHGILADWVGTRSASFRLSPKAFLADLITEIRHRYRQNMPEQLWDEEKGTFHGKVLAVGPEGIPKSLGDPLAEGEEIKFFLMMSGG
jgi:hypothetical protein